MIKLRELFKPPYMRFDDPNDELNMALKYPFTAWEYALRRGPDIKLWNVIKGSPYENDYTKKFGNHLK